MTSGRLSRSQRVKYLGICFCLFAGLLIYAYVNNQKMAGKSARQFCIYAVNEDAAIVYEEQGFAEEIFEAFLNDPFTDVYYKKLIDRYNEEHTENTVQMISTDRMSTDPGACADELLSIYNVLRTEKAEDGKSEWEMIRIETYEEVLNEQGGASPYETILKLSEKMTET